MVDVLKSSNSELLDSSMALLDSATELLDSSMELLDSAAELLNSFAELLEESCSLDDSGKAEEDVMDSSCSVAAEEELSSPQAARKIDRPKKRNSLFVFISHSPKRFFP